MQKLIILGSQGMLGTEMTYYFQGKYEVIPFDYFNLDITNKKLVQETLKKYQPNLLINCAAYTDVERAEAKHERELAQEINGLGVSYLAEICSQLGITLIQISTDYIFDGTKGDFYIEQDLPNPQNVYGKTKLWGEEAILKEAKINPNFNYYIIRTAWLYGKYGPNFVKKMLNLAKKQKQVNVVFNQVGSPTSTLGLTQGVSKIIEQKKYTKGIYHLVGKGQTSWANFAKEIFKLKKIDTTVNQVNSNFFPSNLKRPAFSALANTKGPPMPTWEEMLKTYLIN